MVKLDVQRNICKIIWALLWVFDQSVFDQKVMSRLMTNIDKKKKKNDKEKKKNDKEKKKNDKEKIHRLFLSVLYAKKNGDEMKSLDEKSPNSYKPTYSNVAESVKEHFLYDDKDDVMFIHYKEEEYACQGCCNYSDHYLCVKKNKHGEFESSHLVSDTSLAHEIPDELNLNINNKTPFVGLSDHLRTSNDSDDRIYDFFPISVILYRMAIQWGHREVIKYLEDIAEIKVITGI